MCSNSLDNLAANGILNFDADAFVKGSAPRYVGNPEGELCLPFDRPLIASPYEIAPGPLLSGEPHADAFEGHKKEEKTAGWKQALAATLAVVGGLYIGSKFKNSTRLSDLYQSAKSRVTGIYNKAIPSKNHAIDNKAESEVAKAEQKASKTILARVKNLYGNHKALTIGTGIATAALLGLYGLYQTVSGRQLIHSATPAARMPEHKAEAK